MRHQVTSPLILLYERHSLSKLHVWVWDTKDSMITPYCGSDFMCFVSFEIFSLDMYVGECSEKTDCLKPERKTDLLWTTLLHCRWSQGKDCILLKVTIEGHDTVPQKVCGTSLAGSTSQYTFYGIFMLEAPCFLLATSILNHFQMIPGSINFYSLSIICEFFNFFDVFCHNTKSWIPIPSFCFVKFGCWKTHDACRLHPCFRAVGGLLGWIMRRCFLKAEGESWIDVNLLWRVRINCGFAIWFIQ